MSTHFARIALFIALAASPIALAQAPSSPPAAPAAPPAAAPAAAPAAQATPKVGSFRVVFDAAVQPTAYSGRIYVALAKGGQREPRQGMGSWSGSSQVFTLDVTDIAPGGAATVGATALSFPKPYADSGAGAYFAQAVARRSLDSCTPGAGAGDLYSEPVRVDFAPGNDGVVELKLTKMVTARAFRESDRVKLFTMVSPKLSKFLGRDFTMNAGVILPKDWRDDPAQHYPTLYWIGGFSGDHHSAGQMARMLGSIPGADRCLIVVPDPTCYRGHSVFADSETNGPWGAALVQDLIPAIEAKYHGSGTAEHRFVSGISSGGWSSLWLQVAYPDAFNGVWSHCPDPVDFHDFQQIDLYATDANMYKDAAGQRRPLARNGETVMLWYDDFVRQRR